MIESHSGMTHSIEFAKQINTASPLGAMNGINLCRKVSQHMLGLGNPTIGNRNDNASRCLYCQRPGVFIDMRRR